MYCSNCGYKQKDIAKFCSRCGSPVSKKEIDEVNRTETTCPYCKAPIKPDDETIVCPECNITHHQNCWDVNRGCTSSDCSEADTESIQNNDKPIPISTETTPGENIADVSIETNKSNRSKDFVWLLAIPIIALIIGLVYFLQPDKSVGIAQQGNNIVTVPAVGKEQLAREILFKWQPTWGERLKNQMVTDSKTATFVIDSEWKPDKNVFLFHIYNRPPANQSGFTQTVGWYEVNPDTGEIYDFMTDKLVYLQAKGPINNTPVKDEKLAILNAAAAYCKSQFGIIPKLESPYGTPAPNDPTVYVGEIIQNRAVVTYNKVEYDWSFIRNSSGEWVFEHNINYD